MDERSQKTLAKIIAKSKQDLTAADIVFLKARRAYLTPDQEEKLLGDEVVQAQPVVHVLSNDGLPKTMPELKSLAKSLGLTIQNTTKMVDLKQMILEAQKQ